MINLIYRTREIFYYYLFVDTIVKYSVSINPEWQNCSKFKMDVYLNIFRKFYNFFRFF